MKPYIYLVKEFENYDGDSFKLVLDLGFSLSLKHQCRLMGVDTPELRGGTDMQKKAGYLARDVVRRWAEAGMLGHGELYFNSENLDGKFGRPLGDLVRKIPEFDGGFESLREYLTENNYGVPYYGQAKKDIEDLHAKNLEILIGRGEL